MKTLCFHLTYSWKAKCPLTLPYMFFVFAVPWPECAFSSQVLLSLWLSKALLLLFFSTKSCLTLRPHEPQQAGFPCPLPFPKLAQIHIHWFGDTIQPSHLLFPPSLPALNLSQLQGFLQWVGSSHQVAKVLELQLQQQSFQWIFRVDFL